MRRVLVCRACGMTKCEHPAREMIGREPVPYDTYVEHTNSAWRGGIRDAANYLRERNKAFADLVTEMEWRFLK